MQALDCTSHLSYSASYPVTWRPAERAAAAAGHGLRGARPRRGAGLRADRRQPVRPARTPSARRHSAALPSARGSSRDSLEPDDSARAARGPARPRVLTLRRRAAQVPRGHERAGRGVCRSLPKNPKAVYALVFLVPQLVVIERMFLSLGGGEGGPKVHQHRGRVDPRQGDARPHHAQVPCTMARIRLRDSALPPRPPAARPAPRPAPPA